MRKRKQLHHSTIRGSSFAIAVKDVIYVVFDALNDYLDT